MFSVQSLLVGNGTSVTCLRKSREPITALNVATYVTPLMVRNFWLCVVQLFLFLFNFPGLEPVGDNSHLCESQLFFKVNNHIKQFFMRKITVIEYVSPYHTVRPTLQLSVQQSLILGLFPTSHCFLLLAVQCQRFARSSDRVSAVRQD